MAGTVHGLLNELSARLPELEWKLANLHAFNPLSLPKGLFQTANTPDASAFIAEVKKTLTAWPGAMICKARILSPNASNKKSMYWLASVNSMTSPACGRKSRITPCPGS